MKYCLSPKEIPRAEPEGFPGIPLLSSQYSYSIHQDIIQEAVLRGSLISRKYIEKIGGLCEYLDS